MTDYTKSVDYAAKDSLPSGNANKVVSGTEINTEFANIETAVNSKANTSSPTFTGTVTIPTIDANAGAIDGTTIGASSASTGVFTTITGTVITASTNFAGNLTGNVTGNLTGNVTGNITGTAPAGTLTGATLASNVLSSSLTSLGTITSLVATTADINGGTIDGTTIGASSASTGAFTTLTASTGYTGAVDGIVGGTTPAAGTFTTLNATGGGALTGTWTDLGSVTTIDINGGTIDGTTIGAGTPAAGTFTTFTSNGIDDNATGERFQVGDSSMELGGSLSANYPVSRSIDTQTLAFSGGSSGASGGNIVFYGGTHASQASDWKLRANTDDVFAYDHSANLIYVPSDDFVVGGTTAGAASAVTAYADGTFKSNGIDDNASTEVLQVEDSGITIGAAGAAAYPILRGQTSAGLILGAGSTASLGANLLAYGESHATAANDWYLRQASNAILGYDHSADVVWVPSDDFVVGGTTAGAASAATLYATGAGAFWDSLSVSETAGTATFQVIRTDGSTVQMLAGSTSGIVGTTAVGDDLVLRGDANVTNLTLSGASGSELLTAAGSVSVTDFLTLNQSSELTIASGVVTATASYHVIDTEGDAATDDCATINGAATGKILIVRSANNARDITFKDGTGNMFLAGDFTTASTLDRLGLMGIGSQWVEIFRSSN